MLPVLTHPVDARLSETRDMDAAQRFFRQAVETSGRAPEQVTTDGHDACPRAIRETFGDQVAHCCSRYLNNRILQDHRAIKQRYYPMRGFGSFASAARFCPAFEEQRQYFRTPSRPHGRVPLAAQRCLFQDRWTAVQAETAAA